MSGRAEIHNKTSTTQKSMLSVFRDTKKLVEQGPVQEDWQRKVPGVYFLWELENSAISNILNVYYILPSTPLVKKENQRSGLGAKDSRRGRNWHQMLHPNFCCC